MQRLVVSLDVPGDWDCNGYTEVYPAVYESSEAFLVHLADRLKKFVADRKVFTSGMAAWEKTMPRKRGKNYDAKVAAWYESRPKGGVDAIIAIGGQTFYAATFVDHEDKITLPMVRTADDWYRGVEEECA